MLNRFAAVSLTVFLAFDATPVLAQRIPPGSYQQSCTHIRVSGQQLIANCSAPNGRRVVSRVAVNCRGDIGNVNGYLRCNGNRKFGHRH
jgi:hypothetical protein